MANTDAPFGFKPVRHRFGAEIRATKYIIASDESSDIGIGDPVVRSGTASTTAPNIGVPIVTQATAGAGNLVTGIVESVGPVRNDLSLNYYDASAISSEVEVWVIDDPHVIFICQDDGDSNTLAATDIGEAFDIILTHSTDTTTGISGAELDANTAGAGNTGQLQLLRLYPKEGNEIGDFGIWEVAINYHSEAPGVAGI